MQKININSNIVAFYFGAEADPERHYANSPVENDWVVGACHSLGVASYAVYSGNSCLIFDTLCSPEQANIIKEYMENELGITKFTVILSHWHLHHIGGNELYKAYNIIATKKTRQWLQKLKPQIEAGTSSWGLPGIEKVRLPDIVFENTLSIFINNLEVQLYSFNIHSEDGLCAYIPQYKALLAGDMVEDTIPFISDPQDVENHVQNYPKLGELDIDIILPNHCRLQALKNGGYNRSLMESSCYYLSRLSKILESDFNAQVPELKSFMSKYLNAGQISFWPPYERIHKNNIQKMREYFKCVQTESL